MCPCGKATFRAFKRKQQQRKAVKFATETDLFGFRSAERSDAANIIQGSLTSGASQLSGSLLLALILSLEPDQNVLGL